MLEEPQLRLCIWHTCTHTHTYISLSKLMAFTACTHFSFPINSICAGISDVDVRTWMCISFIEFSKLSRINCLLLKEVPIEEILKQKTVFVGIPTRISTSNSRNGTQFLCCNHSPSMLESILFALIKFHSLHDITFFEKFQNDSHIETRYRVIRVLCDVIIFCVQRAHTHTNTHERWLYASME